jgi:hypothetical protein
MRGSDKTVCPVFGRFIGSPKGQRIFSVRMPNFFGEFHFAGKRFWKNSLGAPRGISVNHS